MVIFHTFYKQVSTLVRGKDRQGITLTIAVERSEGVKGGLTFHTFYKHVRGRTGKKSILITLTRAVEVRLILALLPVVLDGTDSTSKLMLGREYC